MTPELLDVLCCPVARDPLRVLSPRELAEINAAFAEGLVRYANGVALGDPLSGGLTTGEGGTVYRVYDRVPYLVPALRIVRSDDAGVPPVAPPGRSPLADVWVELSQRWHRINPPLRPAGEDVDLFQHLAGEALARLAPAARRALLLGVTPEVATMRWPVGTTMLALDSSPAMIRNVWPATPAGERAVALADWKAMPVRDGACAFVIGDGILTSQRYPDDFRTLAAELRRAVRDDGALVLRLFARPEEPDPLDDVFADLRAGRIANFDLFHWRFAMAMHGDLASGTRVAALWDEWHERVPDPERLMVAIGWAPDAARVLETYRGLETSISFPTVTEVREILASRFVMTTCRVPTYEAGDRYPTVAFRPL